MYLEYFSRSSNFKHFRPTSLPSFLSSVFFPVLPLLLFLLFPVFSSVYEWLFHQFCSLPLLLFLLPTLYPLFYFLLSVISFLFLCRGIPGACTNTHTHIMKLDCAVVFPSRCLPGNRPHPCMVYFPFAAPPPPCWHKELMEYK